MSKKNNYGFNDFSFIKRKKIPKYLVIICAILVTSLTIGFASFSSSLVMKSIAVIRVDKTVRLTGISVNSTNSGAISRTEEYNVSNIFGDVVLPSEDSYVKYEVDITNLGNVKMGALISKPMCTGVTEATTGNIPSGNFNYGDEYVCQVGDNYSNTFFVLENNTDTVSLIMQENFKDSYVPQALAWCVDGTANSTTCKNITATGSNAVEGKDYLGHIKEVFNKSGVEVSFPSAYQVATAAGKTFSQSAIYGIPKWLYGNLTGRENANVYWTTTPYTNNSTTIIWTVDSSGALYSHYQVNDTSYTGVRPVITLSKSSFSTDTNLDYTIDDYNENDVIPVCDGDNCTNGVTKKIYITIKYKDGIDDSLVTSEPQSFNIGFDYKQIFKVTYDDVTCTDCASEVVEGNTYTSTINLETPKVVMGGIVLTNGTDYTYDTTTKLLTIPNVNGDITISKGLSYICTPVTTSTTGNIPSGSLNSGDEYTCQVGDNYTNTFFVLETSGDNVSLIMNANVGEDGKAVTSSSTNLSKVVWATKEDYMAAGGTESDYGFLGNNNKGPITANKALREYTSTWINVSSSQITLPTASQIAAASGQTFNNINSQITDLPTWLYDYLNETLHPVSDVSGYWTSTPSVDGSYYSWRVDNQNLYYNIVSSTSYGVRPVITIPKSKVKPAETVKTGCTAVTTATTGNVPNGSYNYGDEYTCKVGDNYINTFFVLENNTNTVSLIMKENFIDSYVPQKLAWCTDGTTDTKTCKNISSTGSSATDGKDYLSHIKSIFNNTLVQVSFPSAYQIATASGETFTGSGVSNIPTWLYGNLSSSTISAYWTTTVNSSFTTNSWLVSSNGSLGMYPANSTSYSGLRPVITISKDLIN